LRYKAISYEPENGAIIITHHNSGNTEVRSVNFLGRSYMKVFDYVPDVPILNDDSYILVEYEPFPGAFQIDITLSYLFSNDLETTQVFESSCSHVVDPKLVTRLQGTVVETSIDALYYDVLEDLKIPSCRPRRSSHSDAYLRKCHGDMYSYGGGVLHFDLKCDYCLVLRKYVGIMKCGCRVCSYCYIERMREGKRKCFLCPRTFFDRSCDLRHVCRYSCFGASQILMIPVDDVLKLDVKKYHEHKRKVLCETVDDEFFFSSYA